MLPKRKPLRLSTYDYTNNGLYFVTICTKGKAHILGRLENQKIKFTLAGHIVNRTICDMGNPSFNMLSCRIMYTSSLPSKEIKIAVT